MKTIAFCQPRYERELSEEDGRLIVENLVGFFRTLLSWHTESRAAIAFDEEREAA